MQKLLLIAAITGVLASNLAVAQNAPPPPRQSNQQGEGRPEGDFTQMKQHIAQSLQNRIKALQAAQSCVNAATNHEALRACHDQERDAMESFRHRQ